VGRSVRQAQVAAGALCRFAVIELQKSTKPLGFGDGSSFALEPFIWEGDHIMAWAARWNSIPRPNASPTTKRTSTANAIIARALKFRNLRERCLNSNSTIRTHRRDFLKTSGLTLGAAGVLGHSTFAAETPKELSIISGPPKMKLGIVTYNIA
jgi:hypothetical protein